MYNVVEKSTNVNFRRDKNIPNFSDIRKIEGEYFETLAQLNTRRARQQRRVKSNPIGALIFFGIKKAINSGGVSPEQALQEKLSKLISDNAAILNV